MTVASDDLVAFRRDLIAFLRARLDEEAQRTAILAEREHVAVAVEDLRAALTPGIGAEETVAAMRRLSEAADGAPIDPAPVLRDIEAKRQIIDYCDDWRRDEFETGPILELLARPYVDHDDYQESWKP